MNQRLRQFLIDVILAIIFVLKVRIRSQKLLYLECS